MSAEPSGDHPQPALEDFQRLAGAPVLPIGLGCEIAADETSYIEAASRLRGGEGIVDTPGERNHAGPARAASVCCAPSDTP